jgi:hypothetical protein
MNIDLEVWKSSGELVALYATLELRANGTKRLAGRARCLDAQSYQLSTNEERKLAAGTAAERAVSAVLTGGPTAALGSSLTSSGAPAALLAALMGALTNLRSIPTPAAMKAASLAYNAVINACPPSFWNNLPPTIQAIRGSLLDLRLGM